MSKVMEKSKIDPTKSNSPSLSILKKENLGNQVFERVKGMILRGEIPAGKRIIESDIANFMGISRTPVREAVHKLEAEGFLNALSKGGYVVRGLSLSDIEETFDIRSILESFAAHLAAIRYTDEELLPLNDKIEEFQRHLDRHNLKELARINTDFHELLYALSRSPRLIRMIHGLRDEIFLLREVILHSEEMARLSNKDHKEIIRAIRKREVKKVEMLVREHILRGKEFVLNEIKKGNLDTES